MKRSLFAAAAMTIVLCAAQLPAGQEAASSKMVRPDWHYRWHEGRWWYWMPENSKWMVWNGATGFPRSNS